MLTYIIISLIVIFVILGLSVMSISKGYSYKHTVDPVDELPNTIENKEVIKKEAE
jgi:hypothetical protein